MSCEFSVGWAITAREPDAIGAIPKQVWADVVDADGAATSSLMARELRYQVWWDPFSGGLLRWTVIDTW